MLTLPEAGSRTTAISKTERFVIIVNGLDVAAVLDPPLITTVLSREFRGFKNNQLVFFELSPKYFKNIIGTDIILPELKQLSTLIISEKAIRNWIPQKKKNSYRVCKVYLNDLNGAGFLNLNSDL